MLRQKLHSLQMDKYFIVTFCSLGLFVRFFASVTVRILTAKLLCFAHWVMSILTYLLKHIVVQNTGTLQITSTTSDQCPQFLCND